MTVQSALSVLDVLRKSAQRLKEADNLISRFFDRGDAEGLIFIGELFLYGVVLEQSFERSLFCFSKAGEVDESKSTFALARWHFYCAANKFAPELEPSLSGCRKLLAQCAGSGHWTAQYLLFATRKDKRSVECEEYPSSQIGQWIHSAKLSIEPLVNKKSLDSMWRYSDAVGQRKSLEQRYGLGRGYPSALDAYSRLDKGVRLAGNFERPQMLRFFSKEPI